MSHRRILGAIVAFGLVWSVGTGRAKAQQPAAPARAEAGDLKLANRLLAERLYAPAAEEYERVLARARPGGSEQVEATYGLALSKLFLNRLAEARKQFDEFLKLAPDHPSAANAWFRLGETSYLLGDHEAARRALDRFTTQFPQHRQAEIAWPYLGDINLKLGDLDASRRAYEQALKLHPNGRLADRARCGLAKALASSGQTDQALALLEPLAGAKGQEFGDQARFQIGQIHLAAGRPELALATFERLEAESPRSPLLPEARLARASALALLGRRPLAEEILRGLVAESPRNQAAQAAYELGISQMERGETAEAQATFLDACERFAGAPTVPALMFRAAEASARMSKPAEARSAYIKMAALFPQDPWADDALFQAATLSLKAKDFEDARETASSLVDGYPKSSLIPAARLIQARSSLETDRTAEALRILEDLVGTAGISREVANEGRYYLGLAYRNAGKKDEAMRVFDELAKAPGGQQAARGAGFLVGQSLIEEGKYAEAVGPLEGYLADQPDGDVADVALAHLVHARIELGQPESARQALDGLAERFPRSKELPRTRLRAGEDALKREQFAQAAEWLGAVVDGGDTTWKPRALSGLGWALYRQGKVEDAASALGRLLEEAPEDPLAPEAAYLRGKALEAAGKPDLAITAYAEAEKAYPRSKSAATSALARARLLAAGRQAGAADAFAAYLETYTKSGEEGTDAVLAEWASALVEAGRTAESDKVSRRLLELFPDGPFAADARLNLAVSAFDGKQYDDVETLLGPVLAEEARAKADPEVLRKALFLQGRALVEKQDWPGAGRAFHRIVAEFPDSQGRPQALFWQAEVAFRAGDPKAAEPDFAALIDAPPGGEAADWVRTAWLRRVQCLVQLQRWNEALAQAEALKGQLAAEDRLRPELEYQRGRALQSMAPPRFADARAAYDEAIAARPPDELAARAQFMKGETYFFAQDYANARREFLKAYTQYNAPRWQAASLLEAAKVYEKLDHWPEAVELYEKLRSRFGTVPDAAESVSEANRRLEAARRKAGEVESVANRLGDSPQPGR
ncbi:MAG: tetratricopeptide repeat protein [Isosphaeraceae bacterium]